jgi:hypothetical protein
MNATDLPAKTSPRAAIHRRPAGRRARHRPGAAGPAGAGHRPGGRLPRRICCSSWPQPVRDGRPPRPARPARRLQGRHRRHGRGGQGLRGHGLHDVVPSRCARLYMHAIGQPGADRRAIAGRPPQRGRGLGGTGLSNPMKSFAQIERSVCSRPRPPKAVATASTAPCPGSATWPATTTSAPLPAVMDGAHSGPAGKRGHVHPAVRCARRHPQGLPQVLGHGGARAPTAVQCKDPGSSPPADTVADPARPLHPQHPRGLRDAAVRHRGRHRPGRHRQHLGGGSTSWATSTSTWTTGPRTSCRPSWTTCWPA